MKSTGFIVPLIITLATGGAPLLGQATQFNPEVELEAGREDNVYLRPEETAEADTSLRARLVLPWLHSWNGGSLLFSYTPSYEKYADLEELDHDEHFLNLILDATPGRKSTIAYGLSFENAQGAADLTRMDVPDPILLRRIERNILNTDLSLDREAGRKLSWSIAGGGSLYRYTELDGTVEDGIEDRDEYRGSAGLHFIASQSSRIGAEVSYDKYYLEETGDEDIGRISLIWNKEFGRRVDMEMEAGWFHRDSALEGAQQNASGNGALGHLMLTMAARRTTFTFFASSGPSGGGAVRSTSTDTTVRLVAEGEAGPRWIWSLAGIYAKQDPTIEELPDLTSAQLAAGLEWRPHSHWGFRATLHYLDRSGSGSTPDISAFTARLGAVWYPKGPQRPLGLAG